MTRHLLAAMLLSLGPSTLLLADADAGGSCGAPAPAAQSPAVDVPQYVPADDDDAPDPAEQARTHAWSDYQRALIASLKASSDPRDWAIAVTIDFGIPFDAKAAAKADNIAFLRRAAKASPDDVLTQWIVLVAARHLDAADVAAEAADRLTQIEPDNAAAWMEVLQRAAMHHDRAGVTAALSHMSATSRMNNHFPDLSGLVAQAFERNPMPEALTAESESSSRAVSPHVFAMAIASASALPAYQFLTTACLWDASGRNADRAQDCERVGRTMAQHSDTLISRSIGFVVLRLSRTFNDDDIEAARQLDWIVENYSDLLAKTPGRVAIYNEADEAAAYHHDWLESGSETEAMRRRIVRAGVSPTPPNRWVGKSPRFSPERIEQDEANSSERIAKAAY